MIAELVNKYTNAIANSAVLISQHDLGAVRLALRLALDELQAARQADIKQQDAIAAELIRQRDQLKAMAAIDAQDLLRLQTMEDRLVTFASEHMPLLRDAMAASDDVADAVIAALSRAGSATVAPPPAPITLVAGPHLSAVSSNGVEAFITYAPPPAAPAPAAPANNSGQRFKGTDDELRQAFNAALADLGSKLGYTPSMREWNSVCQTQYGLITVDGLRKRLGLTWNQMCQAAGFTANQSFAATASKEDEADNAAAPFRG